MAPSSTPLAYSYTRFSSAKQSGGDSFRRQSEAAEEWCRKEGGGLALDTSLRDFGVPGFKGRNAKHGALSLFLKAIDLGQVARGSVLVLEDLDRLSRDEALKALDVLRKICAAGVEVVTLMDRKRYSEKTIYELTETLTLVILFSRGHDESKKKSLRLAEVWKQKRKQAAAGVPMASRAPAWLTVKGLSDTERQEWGAIKFVPNERARMVKQIFQWSIDGWGYRRIAKELVRLKYAPWGRAGWSSSTISKLITSRTVLGEFQPCIYEGGQYGKRVPHGAPVKDYYPRIISDETWELAQSNVAPRQSGRRGMAILAGLIVDPKGQKMHHVQTAQWRYVISDSFGSRFRWQADHLESAVLEIVDGLDWQRIFTDQSQEPERIKLGADIAQLDREEAKMKEQAAKVVEMMLDGGAVIGEALRKKAAQIDAQLATIKTRRAAVRSNLDAMRRTAAAVSGEPLAKTVPDTEGGRLRLHAELKSRLKQIQLWPDGRTPNGEWKEFLADALELAPKRAALARAKGRVMGAIRLFFSNDKAITAYVTYVSNTRMRKPVVLGHANATGMTLEEWHACLRHGGFGSEALARSEVVEDGRT